MKNITAKHHMTLSDQVTNLVLNLNQDVKDIVGIFSKARELGYTLPTDIEENGLDHTTVSRTLDLLQELAIACKKEEGRIRTEQAVQSIQITFKDKIKDAAKDSEEPIALKDVLASRWDKFKRSLI